jgi:ribosomal protein S27E
MHSEDWDDVAEFAIIKCTACNEFVWYQDDTEQMPEACRVCGNVLIHETTCKIIGFTIGGESYFYIDDESVHEESISLEMFHSL